MNANWPGNLENRQLIVFEVLQFTGTCRSRLFVGYVDIREQMIRFQQCCTSLIESVTKQIMGQLAMLDLMDFLYQTGGSMAYFSPSFVCTMVQLMKSLLNLKNILKERFQFGVQQLINQDLDMNLAGGLFISKLALRLNIVPKHSEALTKLQAKFVYACWAPQVLEYIFTYYLCICIGTLKKIRLQFLENLLVE